MTVVAVAVVVFGRRGFPPRLVVRVDRRRWLRVGLVGRRRVWVRYLLLLLSRRGFGQLVERVGQRRIVRSRRMDLTVVVWRCC